MLRLLLRRKINNNSCPYLIRAVAIESILRRLVEWIEQKSQPFYTATPDQDGSKSQLRDWKILLVLTLIKVLKQCPIQMEKKSHLPR